MKNLFNKQDVDQTIERINALASDTQGQWGKMSVDQMLAHCNVTYEMVYGLPPFYSRAVDEMYRGILYKPLKLPTSVS